MNAVANDEDAVSRWSWLLSTVWLLFLVLPAGALLTSSRGAGAKAIALALMALFALVYADSFRVLVRREAVAATLSTTGAAQGDDRTAQNRLALLGGARHPGSAGHIAVLAAIFAVAVAVGGWPLLGVLPFVVAAAVFHLRWTWAIAALALGAAGVVGAPLLAGVFDDLWVLTPVLISVGVSAVLIRVVGEREADRAAFQTQLAVSDERARVARDVHDVLGHSLTAVVLKVELAQRLAERVTPAGPDAAEALAACRSELVELESISRQALTEIRSTVGGLRARALPDELAAARSVLADADVALTVTGDPAVVPDRYRPTLAWVVREAVTNIVRHAAATNCIIEFAPGPAGNGDGETGRAGLGRGRTLLRISDDGQGIGQAPAGNGLRGLHERVAAAGAELRVNGTNSESTRGTRMEVVV